jgi:hypothetical protein
MNVLAGYTNVLVYYERMTCDLVIDIRGSAAKAKTDLVDILRKRIAALGPSFCLASAESVRL